MYSDLSGKCGLSLLFLSLLHSTHQKTASSNFKVSPFSKLPRPFYYHCWPLSFLPGYCNHFFAGKIMSHLYPGPGSAFLSFSELHPRFLLWPTRSIHLGSWPALWPHLPPLSVSFAHWTAATLASLLSLRPSIHSPAPGPLHILFLWLTLSCLDSHLGPKLHPSNLCINMIFVRASVPKHPAWNINLINYCLFSSFMFLYHTYVLSVYICVWWLFPSWM